MKIFFCIILTSSDDHWRFKAKLITMFTAYVEVKSMTTAHRPREEKWKCVVVNLSYTRSSISLEGKLC